AAQPSRGRLAVIETVAAGSAKRTTARAREADSERRATAIKAMRPRHASVWTTIAVLLTVAGIVLLLPAPSGRRGRGPGRSGAGCCLLLPADGEVVPEHVLRVIAALECLQAFERRR